MRERTTLRKRTTFRKRIPRRRTVEWLSAALILLPCVLLPCAALAQQRGTTPAGDTVARAPDARSGAGAARAPSADDPEPAVDTADTPHDVTRAPAGGQSSARGSSRGERAAEEARNREAGRGKAQRGAAPGKAMDRLELGTTDITGNRELPKVMYIVPWKRSDLGDLTGKPLVSLIDQTLEPVDRDVFRRENRYYRAVTGGASSGAARGTAAGDAGQSPAGGTQTATGASTDRRTDDATRPASDAARPTGDANRRPAGSSSPAARDER